MGINSVNLEPSSSSASNSKFLSPIESYFKSKFPSHEVCLLHEKDFIGTLFVPSNKKIPTIDSPSTEKSILKDWSK